VIEVSERVPGATMRARALRLRCPWCGVGELFAGWMRMHERCRGCGFKFERESGYFLGSIYVNYGASVVLALVLHLLMQNVWHVAIGLQVVLLAGIVALFGLYFFRWARALWLALDLSLDPPRADEFSPGQRGPQ
jgi:uncharacterized protein (DUF983 family)